MSRILNTQSSITSDAIEVPLLLGEGLPNECYKNGEEH